MTHITVEEVAPKLFIQSVLSKDKQSICAQFEFRRITDGNAEHLNF